MAALLAEPRAAFVQTRIEWGNGEKNWLTRAQRLMQDAHFAVEQDIRARRGMPFQFNGTGGIWRRAAVEEAGGWSHDTLSEDLDLVLRTSLAGWHGVFLMEPHVVGELPAKLDDFSAQQSRWSRASCRSRASCSARSGARTGRTLPLKPEEAFVYSRVDGRSDCKDIALTTGLPLARVEQALLRLGELGALERSAAAPLAPPASHDNGFSPLSDVDLSESDQRLVFGLWRDSSTLDHYQLLGLERSADRSQIEAAYFEKVTAFHPDKHFGKRLGAYKEKLEVVFQRLTLAHDTLGRSKRREEYDATLPPLTPSQAVVSATSERVVSGWPASSISEPSLRPNPSGPPAAPTLIPRHPAVPTISSPQKLSLSPPVMSSPPEAPTPSGRAGAPMPSVPPAAVVRDFSKPPPRVGSPSLPPVSADQRRQIAAHSITRGLRHLGNSHLGNSGPGSKPLESMRPRLSPKPNAHSPSAPPSSRSITLEQAQVAAARADWERAGTLFAKLAGEQKDGHLFARAAECFAQAPRHSTGDVLRKAVDCARQAVSLASHNVQFRLALSRLYADAGLMKSAIGEAERAQELSPGDKKVQSWVQHLKQRDAGAVG